MTQDGIKVEVTDISSKITPRKEWGKQFEAAIAKGELPEENELEEINNLFDEAEW